MEAISSPARWQIVLAYAIIYVVWGSTFLAIRVGVQQVPPLLLAAMRILFAGLLLFFWMMLRGGRLPKSREWSSIALLALLIFLIDYGLLFWAEQRVASGLAAVLMATIPLFTTLLEVWILRTQKLTRRLVLALLIGVGGVALLTSRSSILGGIPVDKVAAGALLIGAMSWSLASVLSRKLPLPTSRFVSSGAQMLVGGAFLLAGAGLFGEFHRFHPMQVTGAAWISLAYLAVAGSILAFTAYVWLIAHQSPTNVGTYAYVNPAIAVLLGAMFGGESLGTRALLGSGCVLVAVLLMTTSQRRPQTS